MLTEIEKAGIATARKIYPTMGAVKLGRLIADNGDHPLGEPLMFCTRQQINSELRRFDASQRAGTTAVN